MDISAPNLSNAPTSSPPPLNDQSSPQTSYNAEPVDDSRFVMPSIGSPYPQTNTIKTDTTSTNNSTTNMPNPNNTNSLQQPTIPLPFLNPSQCHPSHMNSHHSHSDTLSLRPNHHSNHTHAHSLNLNTNTRSICNNNNNNNNNSNQHRVQQPQGHHTHTHTHTPQQHQQCNRINNGGNHNHHIHGHNPSLHRSNNMCMGPPNMRPNMRPQLSNTPSNNSLISQRLQQQQQQQQQQRANGTTNANANANGANNNINNVNHIQNKYNTTIINLNGVSVPPNNNPTPYYPQIHATAPLSMQQQQQQQLISDGSMVNNSVNNNSVNNSEIHSYEETINIPYPSVNHINKNNINIIRAKALTNAQHPMASNITKRGSIMGGKYKILSILADGTFSRTVCAQNINTLKLVAVKIMKDKCQYVGVQEAKRLSFFNNKDPDDVCHVVRFIEIVYYQGRLCLVLEILGISLFKYLQNNETCDLNLVRKIAIQLMISIQFVHSLNQIHADLKPENILLCKPQNIANALMNTDEKNILKSDIINNNSDDYGGCKVKVIDFGNSISLQQREAYLDKFEVQSLYYRAPEVLLGCRFGLSIDLWSIGCILMELVLGKPLFATNNKSSLCQQIHNMLGPFPIHAYQNAKFYKEYFNKPSFITHQSIYSQLFSQRYEGIDKILKNKFLLNDRMNEWTVGHDHFVQFIASLLDLDPSTRMKASDSFYHPFLQKLFPFKMVFSNSNNNTLSVQRIKKDGENNTNNNGHNNVKKLSLSNIDLSDNNALQKHKSQMCHHQHQFGAECTKLPPNFRNPLIQQLHQTQQQQQQPQQQVQQQQTQVQVQHRGHNNNNNPMQQHPHNMNVNMNVNNTGHNMHTHGHNHTHGPHNHHGHVCQTHGHNHTHNQNHIHHQHQNHMNMNAMNNRGQPQPQTQSHNNNHNHQQSHQHIHQHINNINNMNVINPINNINGANPNNNSQFLSHVNVKKPIFLPGNHSNHSNHSMTQQQQQQQRNVMRGNPFTTQNDTKIGLIDNNSNTQGNNGINLRKRNRVINDSQSVSTDFSQPPTQKMKR